MNREEWIAFLKIVLLFVIAVLYEYFRYHACMEIFNNFWYCIGG